MKKSSIFLFVFLFVCSFNISAFPIFSGKFVTKVIIVAGQSNALNYHADAALLKTDSTDAKIPFYFHTGAPPNSGYPVSFNSSSNGEWLTLKYQTQNPYIGLNKNFFGPEISIARVLYKSGVEIYVVKFVCFGTNLAKDWGKGITTGNKLYSLLTKQIDTALLKLKQKGLDPVISGFFWMQGESDAENLTYANAYKSNLKKFISDLRIDLKNPILPFILGRIGNKSSYPYKEIVRSAQTNAAVEDKFTNWVDTDSFPLDTDKIHYLAEGVYKLGEMMAESWLSLQTTYVEQNHLAGNYSLNQNYPNPFNSSTVIKFELPSQCFVNLDIFNTLGRKIGNAANGYFSAEEHQVTVSLLNVPSGVYFYRITAFSSLTGQRFSLSKKMILLK